MSLATDRVERSCAMDNLVCLYGQCWGDDEQDANLQRCRQNFIHTVFFSDLSCKQNESCSLALELYGKTYASAEPAQIVNYLEMETKGKTKVKTQAKTKVKSEQKDALDVMRQIQQCKSVEDYRSLLLGLSPTIPTAPMRFMDPPARDPTDDMSNARETVQDKLVTKFTMEMNC